VKQIVDNWSKAMFKFGESDNEHLEQLTEEEKEFERLNGRGMGNNLNEKDKNRWIELLRRRQ